MFRWFFTDSIGIHHLFLPFFVSKHLEEIEGNQGLRGFGKTTYIDLIIHAPPKKAGLISKGGVRNSLFPNPPLWSSDASGHHQGYAYTMQNSADPWAYERRQYWVPDVPMKSRTSFEGSFDQPKNTGLVGFRRFRVTNFLIFCRVRKGSWRIAWRIETMKWKFRRKLDLGPICWKSVGWKFDEFGWTENRFFEVFVDEFCWFPQGGPLHLKWSYSPLANDLASGVSNLTYNWCRGPPCRIFSCHTGSSYRICSICLPKKAKALSLLMNNAAEILSVPEAFLARLFINVSFAKQP